jgi:hypothetical protein
MFEKLKINILTMLEAKKAKNISNLLTFRKTRKPITTTGITIETAPTHQEATPLPKRVARKIEMATGLNICFLFIAKIYFEAIATKATIPTVIRSLTEVTGNKIRNRITEVIKYDSELT